VTRLARDRDTHLSPEEISREALRQFDTGTEAPSIRRLAAALHVAPSAIYHHYPSQVAIVQAAVELVWQEATDEFLANVPDPRAEDPADVLIATAIATRRAFGRHHRLALHMASNPGSSAFLSGVLDLMAHLFERLGLHGDEAAAAFHTYGSFTFGSVLFAAARRTAGETAGAAPPERRRPDPAASADPRAETRRSLDAVMDLSAVDPARDEELFAEGLRRIVDGFAAG
jgi:AcrR family transcriptional regulator